MVWYGIKTPQHDSQAKKALNYRDYRRERKEGVHSVGNHVAYMYNFQQVYIGKYTFAKKFE